MIISWRIYDNTRVMILGGERMGISRKFSAGIYDCRPPHSTTSVCLGCHNHIRWATSCSKTLVNTKQKIKVQQEVLDQNLLLALNHKMFASEVTHSIEH